MKSLSLTIILFVYCFHAFAQQYVPMPTGKAQWSYRAVFTMPTNPPQMSYEYFQLMQTGDDTTINGVVYKKITKRSWDTTVTSSSGYTPPNGSIVANNPDVFFAGLREDNKRVYLYHNSHWIGSPLPSGYWSEELLYDFTASVGDTVPHINFAQWPDSQLAVKSIDSIQVNGSYRKRYNVERLNLKDNMSIIEGVGTDRGLIGFMFIPWCYCNYTFHCFVDSTTTYSPNAPCAYIWPQGTPTNVQNTKQEADISIYPNPFHDHINIKSTDASSATLYNLTGKLVLTQDLQNTTTVSTAELPSGLYLLKLTDKNGQIVETRKLAKE